MDCRGPAECAHGAFNLLSGICTIYSYHEPVTTNVMSYDRVTLTLSAIVELCQFLRTKGLFQVETVRERSFHCMVTVSPVMADLSGHTACPGRI